MEYFSLTDTLMCDIDIKISPLVPVPSSPKSTSFSLGFSSNFFWAQPTHQIFRDCESGRKNSENVSSYDGDFMGHIRTDCCDEFFLTWWNFKFLVPSYILYNIFRVGIDPSLDNAISHNIGGQLLDNNYIAME